jgi:small subunit ribosomal protein S21
MNILSGGPRAFDHTRIRPVEVLVNGTSREDVEKACHKFKVLFGREGITKQLKLKRAYEKPSAKRRRKRREARDRQLMALMRERMIKTGEWDRRQKKRAQSRISREEKRAEVFND